MNREANRVVGAVLRELRVDSGLTIQQAADRVGAGAPSVISSYERGERTVSVDRLYDLCALYGTDARHVCQVIEQRSRLERAAS